MIEEYWSKQIAIMRDSSRLFEALPSDKQKAAA